MITRLVTGAITTAAASAIALAFILLSPGHAHARALLVRSDPDVDTRLRKAGENGLAGELCLNVLTLETDFVILNTDTGRIAQESQMIREILKEAEARLGIAP